MLSKRYKSTEVDCRTWLHVPSGTPWSTSSEQKVQLKSFWRDKNILIYQYFWVGHARCIDDVKYKRTDARSLRHQH